MNQKNRIFSLNRNQLKYLVIIAMLIDHIAWAFVPMETVLGQVMHGIGRLTGPTMAFFLVEGYVHTHDLKKYLKRLGIFALVSWAPFVYFECGFLPVLWMPGTSGLNSCINIYFSHVGYTLVIIPLFGVIYTLFLALAALWVYDRAPWNIWCKGAAIAVLCLLSLYGDWAVYDILFALALFRYREEPKKKWLAFCGIEIGLTGLFFSGPFGDGSLSGIGMGELLFQMSYNLGIFLVPFLVQFCYNGEGGSKKPFHKWFFYVFYPLHLVILGLLKYQVMI